MRLGEDEEPDTLNLMYSHTAATDTIAGLLFSFVLRYDAAGQYIPDLATEVPTLRNGGISSRRQADRRAFASRRRWADGQPLTSADWLFTYRAVNNPANNVKTRYGWDAIASATAPDPYTIVIRLKRPNVAVLGILAMGGAAYPPLPAHLLGKLPNLNAAAFNELPLSSGPYLLKEWNHGSSLVFVPNPRYFRGAPKVKEVIWKIVPDVNTLFNQLATHEIDVFPNVNPNAIPRFRSIAGISIDHRLIAEWRHLGINLSRPQLADVRVRQAIAEAVDWKRINETVFHGIDRLAVSDIFPHRGRRRSCRRIATIKPTRGVCSRRPGGGSRRRRTSQGPARDAPDDLRHDRPPRKHRIAGLDAIHAARRRHRRRRSETIPAAISLRRTVRSTPANTTSNGRSRPTARSR